MGKNDDMKTQTMLPLSQQVSAWLIQAMGPLESQVVKTSKSTVKSAMGGKVVDRSWALLMRSAFAAFGVELHDGERMMQGRLSTYTTLGFNSSVQPHTAYYAETHGWLKGATNDGSGRVTFVIDNSAYVGHAVDLAIGANDRVHLSYYDATNTAPVYAWGR